MHLRTLDDADLLGRKVLVRLDLNVPVNDRREITDKTRIKRSVPTLLDIIQKGGIPVVLSHFGRPKGKFVAGMSLRFLAETLGAACGCKVHFADDCIGASAQKAVAATQHGDICLLENTRFYPGEEANDPEHAKAMAQLGDVFVADAFSCAHRAHASTSGLSEHLPTFAGRAMEAELRALEAALSHPKRPVVAVVGGAKISTKLPVLRHLVSKVDQLVIGGGMANTFLFADGHDVGASLCEEDMTDMVLEVCALAAQSGCEIILPLDVRVAKEFKAGADHRDVGLNDVQPDEMILDAGPKTITHLGEIFGQAATILWNGPLGAFEIPPFNEATDRAANMAAQRTQTGHLVSVAGGGDTVAALAATNADRKFTYVSTAGGAFLEWLEGKTLPGISILYS